MEDNSQIPDTMATYPYRKALAYLTFSIAALVASILMTVVFTSDLSHRFDSRIMGSEARINFSVVAIFGLVLLSGSILSLRAALQVFSTAHKLEKNGHTTDGVITNKWVDTLERRVLYHVSYRFHEDMEAWEVISKSLYRKLTKGCNVPIRYLKQDPSVSRLDHERLSA